MAENDSILGTIGTIAFWGAVGVAGKEAFNHYKKVSSAVKSNADPNRYAGDVASKLVTSVSSGKFKHSSELGFDTFRQNLHTMALNDDTYKMLSSYYGISPKELKGELDWLSQKFGAPVELLGFDNKPYELQIKGKYRTISLGTLVDERGGIVHASSGKMHRFSSAPRFLDYGFMEDIRNGTSMSSDLIEKYKISANLARIRMLKKNLSSYNHPIMDIQKRGYELMLNANQQYTREGLSNWSRKIWTNTLVPLIHDSSKDYTMSPFDDLPDGITKKFISAMNGFDAGGPLTFGVSKKNIQSALFLDPSIYRTIAKDSDAFHIASIYHGFKQLVGEDFPGDHKLNQLLSRRTKMEGASKFANPILRKASEYINMSPIEMLYSPANGSLNAILASMNIPGIGDEGMIISKSMANRKIISPVAFSMPVENTMMHNNMTRFVDYLVVNAAGSSKVGTKIQSNLSVQQRTMLNQMVTAFADPKTFNANNEFGNIRNAVFKNLVEGGYVPELLEEMSGGKRVKLNRLLRNAINANDNILASTETGDIRIKYSKNMYLSDIAFDKNGIRFFGQHRSRFIDSMAKVWGSLKSIALRIVDDKQFQDIKFYELALAKRFGNDLEAKKSFLQTANWQNVLDSEYGSMRKHISADGIITSQKNKDTVLNRLGDAETAARRPSMPEPLRSFATPFNKDEVSLRTGLFSFDQSSDFYGIRPGNRGSVNTIMADRLRGAGLPSAAQIVESNFNMKFARNMAESFLPMLTENKTPGKNDVVFDLYKHLTSDNLKRIYTAENKTELLDYLKQLTEQQLGAKKVSDNTRFFIRINKQIADGNSITNINRVVPIPTFESPYTMVLNDQFRMYQEGEPLLKQLTQDLLSYTTSELNPHLDQTTRENLWKRLYRNAGDITLNHRNYTHVMSKDVFMGGALDPYTFSDSYLKGFKGKEESISKLLSEFGIDGTKNLDDLHLIGVSSRRYAELMKGKKSPWVIIGRDPGYQFQGFTMGQLIDIDAFNKKLSEITGTAIDPANYGDTYVSAAIRRSVGIDDDKDILKIMSMKEDTAADIALKNKAIQEFHAQEKATYDFMRKHIYGEKAALKPQGSVVKPAILSPAQLIDAAMVEGKGISQLYNISQLYQAPYSNFASQLSDASVMLGGQQVNITRGQKAAILSNFFSGIAERAIGGKGDLKDADLNRLVSMMSSENLNYSESAKTFFDMYNDKFRTDDNIKVSSIFTQNEMESVFREGKKMHNIFFDVVNLKKRGPVDVSAYLRQAFAKGAGGNITDESAQAFMNSMFEQSKPQNSFRNIAETVADASENIIPKVLKNKTVQMLAGASLFAGLVLRSPKDHIKTQEVREESRPRNIPRGADPVSPPEAHVYKPTVKGYNVNVRGYAPAGLSPQGIRSQLSGMGFPVQNTLIDRSQSIDSRYIQQMQEEERINKWNIG